MQIYPQTLVRAQNFANTERIPLRTDLIQELLAECGLAEEVAIRQRDLEAIVLTAACLAGDPRSQRVFARRYVDPARVALRTMKIEPSTADDILQGVWVKLFVVDDRAKAPITSYLGKGDLRTFVRVVATRLALSHLRKVGPVSDTDPPALGSDSSTPERVLVANRTRAQIKEAIEAGTSRLTPDQRLVLRLYHVNHLTIDAIGTALGVHRATAARWVARARAELVVSARTHLKNCLGVPADDVDAMFYDLESQVDVSLSRILADESQLDSSP